MSAPPPYHPQQGGGYPPPQGGPPPFGQQPGFGGSPPGFGGPPPGYPGTPPRRGNRGLLIGGGVALVLLCCVGAVLVGVVAALGGIGSVAGNTSGARAATTGYYDAVRDHEWADAHDYLSRSLGTTVSQSSLQARWTAQEISTGRVTGFTVTNSKVSSNNGRTTATITGTVRYTKASSETKVVNLVKEGDAWRLATLP